MKYKMASVLKQFPKADFSWVQDQRVQKIINRIPGQWYFVGGIVRDSLCGIKTYDIDITTLCSPDEIHRVFQDGFTISTIGKRFGTIAVYLGGFSFEITTARVETNCDGRWADVKQIRCFKLDSSRRDFTINALLFDGKETIIDYHGGIEDLRSSRIRFIGDASQRLQEDYLRVLRYIRFSGRYGQKINFELPYEKEIRASLPFLSRLSPERIGSELTSMVKKPGTNLAIELLNRYDVAQTLFGKNLPLCTPMLITPEEKLAYMVGKIKYTPLGLAKQVKHYVYLLEKHPNLFRRMAEIWQKFNNPKYLNDFLRFNGIKPQIFPKTITINLDYSKIPIKERSKKQIEYLERFFKNLI
jgi:tRNA nucleotidyltransferase/poly(A) polymerase